MKEAPNFIQGQPVLSFELSGLGLAVTIAVIIFMVIFITMLIKLTPSNEDKLTFSEEVFNETPEPISAPPQLSQKQIQQQTQSSGTARSHQDLGLQKPQEEPEIAVNATNGSESLERLKQASPSEKGLEQSSKQSPRQSEQRAFSMWTPRNSGKDCPHKFGYLRGLPKNRPIPEECFGCEKIVDCLVNKKSR